MMAKRNVKLLLVLTVFILIVVIQFVEVNFIAELVPNCKDQLTATAETQNEPRELGTQVHYDPLNGSLVKLQSTLPSQPQAMEPSDPLRKVAELDFQLLKERMKVRMRAEDGVKELWWYIKSELQQLKELARSKGIKQRIDRVLYDAREQYTLLASHQKDLERVTESTMKPGWKLSLSTELVNLMQRRLHYLQNPANCSAAKKLLCSVSKTCGFGCQMHHVAYCFIAAYAAQRTLVLDSLGWKYSFQGWDRAFLPMSNTCTQAPGATPLGEVEAVKDDDYFSLLNGPENAILMPPIDYLRSHPSQHPMAIPHDLADKLMSFHGRPFTWFIGQFLKYIMRPNADLQSYIEKKKVALGITHPIVGVHIRRTDKLNVGEASFHGLEEYMVQVMEWYDRNTSESKHADMPRKVYVASDDADVVGEATAKYPSYTFVSDRNISVLAGNMGSRYSLDSLYGVVFDVWMLSECDFLVCTFSSQICRLAYELMQTRHTDASRNFYTLDDVYYFGGQQAHYVRAIKGHTARSNKEFSFVAGDLIKIAGNERNGSSVGNLKQSRIIGLFPSYKVEDEVVIADFPTYPDVS